MCMQMHVEGILMHILVTIRIEVTKLNLVKNN